MSDFLDKFIGIINSIIEYIKELVAQIRFINDGGEEEPTTSVD